MTTANAYPAAQTIRTIGILGGGQLGMMLAAAALPLGYRCVFLEDAPNCPASLYGQVFTSEQLEDFIAAADVFTLEFENTPAKTVARLKQLSDSGEKQGMFPPPQALEVAQDRLSEKSLFNELGIKTVPFKSVSSKQELKAASEELGLPLVLKTSRGGYDGKGQFVLRSADQIEQAWAELGPAGSLIAESFVTFSREVSIIAVRGQNGEVKTWPLAENHHHNGILSHSIVPAPNSADLQPVAQDYITRLLNHLNYVGVLTLELFVTDKGLYANEMAPRVHNSGHWSIEGAVCSQFENHIRAVAGLPLGSTEVVRPTVMVNIIGQHPKTEDVLALNGAHLHLYNKTEREGRKIGHITLMPNDAAELTDLCRQLAKILPNPLALSADMSL